MTRDAPASARGRRCAAPRSRQELMLRAAALSGVCVGELAAQLGQPLPATPAAAKGFIGQLAELALGADPQAYTRPDFPALGVELKTVPVSALGVPQESTFCCSIAMAQAHAAHWLGSRLQARLACVLWLPVVAGRGVPLTQRRFLRARLWQPSAAEAELLRRDWELLMGQIGAGLAAGLDAHQGEVLQVRPKAAHAAVRTWGLDAEGPARVLPLGFYLRPRFVAGLLKNSDRDAVGVPL